jgi:hypothetical protein
MNDLLMLLLFLLTLILLHKYGKRLGIGIVSGAEVSQPGPKVYAWLLREGITRKKRQMN